MRALPMYLGDVGAARLLVTVVTLVALVVGAASGAAAGRWRTERLWIAPLCLALAWLLGAASFPRDFDEWVLGLLRQTLEANMATDSADVALSYIGAIGRVVPIPLLVGVSAGSIAARRSASTADQRHRAALVSFAVASVAAVLGHFAAVLAVRRSGNEISCRVIFYWT